MTQTNALTTIPATSIEPVEAQRHDGALRDASTRRRSGGSGRDWLRKRSLRGKYAWADGWRRGEVVFVQTAAEMKRPRFYTCVRDASAEQLTTTKFAVVEYREMSRTHRYAIPLRFGDKAAVGELVYVKVDECGAPLIHRVPASRAG